MRVRLIAVGQRLPAWAQSAVAEYARRLPRGWRFELSELPAARGEPERRRDDEGRRILRLAAGAELIACDQLGQTLDTAGWARALARWRQAGSSVALVIGGAEGLSEEVLRSSAARWSLSALTLPHALARVLVVEQLYRASTLLDGHPYHRG
ncbi:MAG: 23S rRNA (pseudouridine(1915)-N(3))-methyltransferase RlmH [Gammaproteobacteria bacterium]|nr:23S rRNA (pseudouridine(1915)-N(3))-methyltransferase RlmH [Gammaproteobacteria bacterium]